MTDVITQEVIRARLDGIVREMQAAVLRTGYSTIIRESHDFSAGITDREGNVVGQHSPLPTHLGAYPDCVRGVLEFYDAAAMREGDCFLTNHPYYSGCPHPSDMVVVTPVFADGEVVAFCASMGHKVDIGGQSPGSRNAVARDLFGEGLCILPVQFMRERVLHREVVQFLRGNTRTPELVLGDLEAQAGALWSIGVRRLAHTIETYGKQAVLDAFAGLGDRTEARARRVIAGWPDGAVEAEAFIDDIANPGETVRIHVAVEKTGDRLILDFGGSGDQSVGPVNVRPPFVRGMANYAAIAMMGDVPNDHGLARAVECRFREGSVICPSFPAPVGFYSMTMPVVEDVVFEALSKISGRPAVAHNSVSGLLVLGAAGAAAVRYEVRHLPTALPFSVSALPRTAAEADFRLERTAFEVPAGRGVSGELAIPLSAPADRFFSEGDETAAIRFVPPGETTGVRLGGDLEFTIREGGASPCPGLTISARPPTASEPGDDRLGSGHLFTRLTLLREPAAAGTTLDFRGPYYWEDRLAEFDYQPFAATRIARWSAEPAGNAIRHELDIEWPDATTLQDPDLELGFLGGACSGEPVASCSAEGCELTP